MEFNSVNFCVLGIPAYFFCAGIGLVISISVFIILTYEKGYQLQTNVKTLFLSLIGMVVSARLFGGISGIYRDVGLGKNITINSVINSGIVFYGGLFGLLISYALITKYKKEDLYTLNLLAVTIPLFHSIARIGCFLAGCCFGKECDSDISIKYTTLIFGVENVSKRIPIQLIEAIFNFLLFLLLLHQINSDDWKEKNILRMYLIVYSVGRFLLEFFRGDVVRGVVHGISFSQILSVFIWIYLLVNIYIKLKNKEEKL